MSDLHMTPPVDTCRNIARLLVDQERARIIVPPDAEGSGSWFGGGNLWAGSDGSLWLVGRYRNPGDSRTGVQAGSRGFALAAFRSEDHGHTFQLVWKRSKEAMAPDGETVLSIEGAALWERDGMVELLVSSEKSNRRYAPEVAQFQKPGTGVWTVDRIVADSLEELAHASVEPLVSSPVPEICHVKDPFLYHSGDGTTWLGLCTHPFNWSSSNTIIVPYYQKGLLPLQPLEPDACLTRGLTWDVAMTRLTAIVDLPVPSASGETRQLVFYDGGECVRPLEPHSAAVTRPRGYSCEELGGLGYLTGGDPATFRRISRWFPEFVSPHGTGCSRYVDVLATDAYWYATWQQSQPDQSQPLVCHAVPTDEIHAALKM